MKRFSQSGSSNFCPELRKNALLISQSHFSNFALHVINTKTALAALGRFQNYATLYENGLRSKCQILCHMITAKNSKRKQTREISNLPIDIFYL